MTDKKFSVRRMASTALLTAVMCILSPFSIPIGPVPITLSVFCVFLAGMLLRPVWAAASVVVYLLVGFVGLPVFSGFSGGVSALVSPSGGYLFGYLAIAVATAWGVRCGKWYLTALCMLGGLLGCYLVGTVWFMAVTGMDLGKSLALCVLPFVPFDAAKGVCAYLLASVLKKRVTLD